MLNNLVTLPEERMLLAPDVREEKPAHVRESRYTRTLVRGVVGPDECNKVLHEVAVLVPLVPCDWEVKVQLDPPFDRVPQHGLIATWQKFVLLRDLASPRSKPRARGLTS